MCKSEFQRSPELMVNGMPALEYLTDREGIATQFPYVDVNLYFIFFEVLKNALLTSIRKAGPHGTPPPVHASLVVGTSMVEDHERTVKITDMGVGFSREDARKVR